MKTKILNSNRILLIDQNALSPGQRVERWGRCSRRRSSRKPPPESTLQVIPIIIMMSPLTPVFRPECEWNMYIKFSRTHRITQGLTYSYNKPNQENVEKIVSGFFAK